MDDTVTAHFRKAGEDIKKKDKKAPDVRDDASEFKKWLAGKHSINTMTPAGATPGSRDDQ